MPQGKSRHAPACKRWTPDRGVARNGETMTEHTLSPADAALRQRITELSVHIPCGGLRGPLQRRNPYHPELPVRWQSCRHEDNPEVWRDADVSRDHDLCIICFRATAGGRSRWSWLACEDCRAVNEAIQARTGVRPFALGRHSLMNGIGMRVTELPEVAAAQRDRLVRFIRGDSRLQHWQQTEYRRLAAAFDPLADIPLTRWQLQWPPGRAVSGDAFSRLLESNPTSGTP